MDFPVSSGPIFTCILLWSDNFHLPGQPLLQSISMLKKAGKIFYLMIPVSVPSLRRFRFELTRSAAPESELWQPSDRMYVPSESKQEVVSVSEGTSRYALQ